MFPLYNAGQVASLIVQQALKGSTAKAGRRACVLPAQAASRPYLIQLLATIKKRFLSINPQHPLSLFLYLVVVIKATKVTYHSISFITWDGEGKPLESQPITQVLLRVPGTTQMLP